MEPVKLLERAATTAARAVRHPISSAAYAAGIARGLAGAAIHSARAHDDGDTAQRPVPAQRAPESAGASTSTPSAAPRRPQRVPKPVPPPEAAAEMTVIEPEPPHESFATEPKAVSRESEHGGRATDEEIDAWIDEAIHRDVDVETPVGTTGADVGHNPDTGEADLQQPGTEPLLDPGTAKAIRKESEMLRKDAERDPE